MKCSAEKLPRVAMTLIELVVVLLVIGILAAVTTPRVADAMSSARIRATARLVVADISYAQHQARVQGAEKTIEFYPASDSYLLVGVADMNDSGQPYQVDLTSEPYEATLASAAFGSDGTVTKITFNRFGRPDFGGSLIVAVGSEQRTVVVDAVSGKATVQP